MSPRLTVWVCGRQSGSAAGDLTAGVGAAVAGAGAGRAGATGARSTTGAGVRVAQPATTKAIATDAIARRANEVERSFGGFVVIRTRGTRSVRAGDDARQASPGSNGTNLTASKRCSRKLPADDSITVRYWVPRSPSSGCESGITMRPPGLR